MWKDTTFRTISESLNSLTQTTSVNTGSNAQEKPVEITKNLTKSKSSSLLGSISKTIFGPGPSKALVKLGKEVKKAEKKVKKGRIINVDYDTVREQLAAIQETGIKPKQNIHKIGQQAIYRPVNFQCSEETGLKTVFTDASSLNGSISSYEDSVEADVETRVCEDDVLNDVESQSANYLKGDILPAKDTCTQLTENSYELGGYHSNACPNNALPQETECKWNSGNLEQKVQVEILAGEVTSVSEKNAQIEAENRLKTKEISKLKTYLAVMIKEEERKQKTIVTMQKQLTQQDKKIADLNSKLLILDEENNKLKSTNKNLTSEGKRHQSEIRRISTISENNENIASNVSDLKEDIDTLKTALGNLKSEVEKSASTADLNLMKADLKNTLRQEICDLLKNQMCPKQQQQPINVDENIPQQNKCDQNVQIQAQMISTEETATNKPQEKKRDIFIVGDSVTKVLNPKRLTGDKYTTTISTNPGALIQDINSKLANQNSHLKTCDAIIIHAGINNVSEAETSDSIVNKYKDLVSTVGGTNKKAKIIISSILPKPKDKLSTKVIMETNDKLKKLCNGNQQLLYMNNTSNFTSDKGVISDLFVDEVHLSARGAAVLAKNIMAAINACLNTGYNAKHHNTSGNFRKPSLQKTVGQHRRNFQVRQWGSNPRMPHWMKMAQYWGPPPMY